MAICAFQFEARNNDELSFDRGVKLELLETPMLGGWWKGRIGDKKGWFPNNHVRELIAPPGLRSKSPAATTSLRRSKSLSSKEAAVGGLSRTKSIENFNKGTGSENTSEAPKGILRKSKSSGNLSSPQWGNAAGWSCDRVGDWLESLGFAEYQPMFYENEIEGKHLLDMTKDDLKELGVSILGHRLTILKAINQLKE